MEEHWSLTDLIDAHEALDIREEVEYFNMPENMRK